MSISISASTGMALWSGSDAGKTSSNPVKNETPEDAFLKEAHKTPARRIRDAILKKMGVTEEQLASMEPARRDAIEKEIVREMANQLNANNEKKAGFFADLRV